MHRHLLRSAERRHRPGGVRARGMFAEPTQDCVVAGRTGAARHVDSRSPRSPDRSPARARSPHRRADPARRPERSRRRQGEPRRRRDPRERGHPGQVHQRAARQRLPADDVRRQRHRLVGQEPVPCDGHRHRQHGPAEQPRSSPSRWSSRPSKGAGSYPGGPRKCCWPWATSTADDDTARCHPPPEPGAAPPGARRPAPTPPR